jgi:hypothetical protein
LTPPGDTHKNGKTTTTLTKAVHIRKFKVKTNRSTNRKCSTEEIRKIGNKKKENTELKGKWLILNAF